VDVEERDVGLQGLHVLERFGAATGARDDVQLVVLAEELFQELPCAGSSSAIRTLSRPPLCPSGSV
jgi:hypothetical protein